MDYEGNNFRYNDSEPHSRFTLSPTKLHLVVITICGNNSTLFFRCYFIVGLFQLRVTLSSILIKLGL